MPKEKTTIAKLKRGSMHFEVIINPEKAVAYNQGRASMKMRSTQIPSTTMQKKEHAPQNMTCINSSEPQTPTR